jgi:pentatricopeptide repeat protein
VKELYKLFIELRSKYNLQPDVNIYYVMLKTYKRIGAIDKATAIIEEMKANGIITSTSLIVEKITSFIVKKQPNDAEEYLEKNWKELQINDFERMQLLYIVLQAYLEKGALKSRIENLINRMEKDFNIRPNTKCYNILISACSRDCEPIENTVQLLSKFSPDVETFFMLISACRKQNNMEEAWKILEAMKKQYNISPSYDIYNIFISYYCSIDGAYSMEKASQLFNMMLNDKNNRPTRTILEHMIRGYLMKNMEKEAEEMYEIHQKKGLVPSYHTVKSFVNYYSKIKTIEGITKLRKWKKQLRDNYP